MKQLQVLATIILVVLIAGCASQGQIQEEHSHKDLSSTGNSFDTILSAPPQAYHNSFSGSLLRSRNVIYTSNQDPIEQGRGPILLFFFSENCSSCHLIDNLLSLHANSLAGDITIVKVPFSDSSKIQQRYGIISVHTFLGLDNKGNEILRTSSIATLQDIQKLIDTLELSKASL